MSDSNENIDMEGVFRRLKKIMALSESSEPGEAAAALHQAERLMAKYQLTMQDVAMSSVGELAMEVKTAEVSRMDRALAEVIKVGLAVEVMIAGYKKMRGVKRLNAHIVFVGEACRTEIAKYVFLTLRRQLLVSMKLSFESVLVGAGVPKNALRVDAKRRDAYAVGWCAAVIAKVKALAPIPDPILGAYVERAGAKVSDKQKPLLKEGKADALTTVMMRKGYADGGAVSLHHGVDKSESALAIAQS
jgi:Protein of unknown function (DUF2786)